MKKLFTLICLLLACNLLSAKDKKIFEKQSKYSFIGFYESGNLTETNGYKYYISVNEDDFEGGRKLYIILSNNYDKIKTFLSDMYKRGNNLKTPVWAFYLDYYEEFHEDLIQIHEDTNIDSKNNMIVDFRIWVLE